HQSNQPFHAGVKVHEPSLALARGGHFDDSAFAPVSFAEFAQLMNLIDDPIDNGAFPARLGPGSRDPLDGMPSSAVSFPRHARISTDGFQSYVAVAWLLVRCRIVPGPFLMRPRSKDGREGQGRVRHTPFLPVALSSSMPFPTSVFNDLLRRSLSDHP